MFNRIRMMVARAVLGRVDDTPAMQTMQIDLLDGETQDGVERFQNYGFTSVPHPQAEVAVAFVGGLRSHGIVIAVGDRQFRLRGLETGEVAIYDDLDQVVHLKRDQILIKSPFKIVVEAPEVHLGAEGGDAVARIGDTVSGGAISTGSTKVFAA
jgi:phage baseplate assembly protein V